MHGSAQIEGDTSFNARAQDFTYKTRAALSKKIESDFGHLSQTGKTFLNRGCPKAKS